ncbi:transcription elongation factor GreA [bacterium]|nr:MAG: transcription elongation factor GreA [bacterium]
MDNKYLFTKQGLQTVKDELHDRINNVRKEIADRIEVAASEGDLSENAAYSVALEDQAMNEARIGELTDMVKNATVAEEKIKNRMIDLGDNFTVENTQSKVAQEYQLVGEEESNPLENKISVTSPLGSAVFQKKAGDEVIVNAPVGKIVYKILSI